VSTLCFLVFAIGHSDIIRSIQLQDDKLFSGSFDGSAKVWTAVRAVELKSFKAFDDRVAAIWPFPTIILAGMTSKLVQQDLNKRDFIIKDVKTNIIGILVAEDVVYIATKTISSLSITQRLLSDEEPLDIIKTINLNDSCGAWNSQSSLRAFFFGTNDGNILQYYISRNDFLVKVIPFYS
jgi:hypothetical protein